MMRKCQATLRKFKTHPSSENLNKYNKYKQQRAKTRRIIKEAKRSSWRTFISKINSNTNPKEIWDFIKKIANKNTNKPINHLSQGNTNATNEKHIANLIANEIHYTLFKELPTISLKYLLDIYNNIWISGNILTIWKQAITIPILKKQKDPTNPTSYRPIALTSCICKTLERMINLRLIWFLESNNLLSNLQTGFRAKRSTIDQIVHIETLIREAFIKKEHLVAVLFDLEKAYDTTWPYGILKDLKVLAIQGRLPIFIKHFLEDWTFQTRIIHSPIQNNKK